MVGRFLSTAFLYFLSFSRYDPAESRNAADKIRGVPAVVFRKEWSLLTYLILILKIAFLMVVGSPTFTAVRWASAG